MNEMNMLFEIISDNFWRFRWHAIVLALCLSTVGWGAMVLLQDNYLATAQIFAGTESGSGLLPSRVADEDGNFTARDMAAQSLLTKQQIEEVLRARGPLQESASGDKRGKSMDGFLERIKIAQSQKWDNLFRVTYSDGDRSRALTVVESFIGTIADASSRASGNNVNSRSSERGNKSAREFRVVDPPTVSPAPTAALRFTWATTIFVVSLFAGAYLAFWLSRWNPVFESFEEKMAVDGVPVIGEITHAWMSQANAQRHREGLVFACGISTLVICYMTFLFV